jgi:anti-sigma regulatory factor (Ser/Thr protein kinase)
MKRSDILKRSGEIRSFILAEIRKNPKGITALVVKQFGISRQAATRYLKQMVAEGQLEAKGTTKDRAYSPGKANKNSKNYDLASPLDESRIWMDDFKPLCEGIQPNVMSICAYGFTEMVNNAIDHSDGKTLTVTFVRTPEKIGIIVGDDGVGIFKKIKEAYDLSDERQAILELSKGKLTTDPKKHTGEGIFFTSRLFDNFEIHSHDVLLSHQSVQENDSLVEDWLPLNGTVVLMWIKLNSERTTKEVFDEFTDPKNDYAFDKTIVPVRLAEEELISRSQAKRLMLRVENFKRVILDFKGVQSVGPAFADEIFRVYRNEHPEVELVPLNASEEVMKMIQRARAAH